MNWLRNFWKALEAQQRPIAPPPDYLDCDGHLIYDCGCAWNKKFRTYTLVCNGFVGRTRTPPHPTEAELEAEQRTPAKRGRHRSH